MHCSCILKRLVLFRIVHLRISQTQLGGPTSYFIQLCNKYNVIEYVTTLIDTGRSVTIDQWTEMCKLAIKKREDFFYAIELGMCEKLSNMYNLRPGLHQWWKEAKAHPQFLQACRFMAKCLVGEEPLAWNTGRHVKPRSIQNQMCTVCNNGGFETIKHFLFECPALCKSRQSFLDTLKRVCEACDDIIQNHNYRTIIAADLYVGADYRSKLRDVGECIYKMFKERHQCLSS